MEEDRGGSGGSGYDITLKSFPCERSQKTKQRDEEVNVEPQLAVSPRNRWELLEVIHTGEGGHWSIARGNWKNREDEWERNVLAIRWNGAEGERGFPGTGAHALWFILPAELYDSIRSSIRDLQGLNPPELSPGDWVRVGKLDCVVAQIYSPDNPLGHYCEVVFNPHKPTNHDVVWTGRRLELAKTGDYGGYADNYPRLSRVVSILKRGRYG